MTGDEETHSPQDELRKVIGKWIQGGNKVSFLNLKNIINHKAGLAIGQ